MHARAVSRRGLRSAIARARAYTVHGSVTPFALDHQRLLQRLFWLRGGLLAIPTASELRDAEKKG